ncbi:YciI family protein [Rhizohabitans arisaemae]|uniref:YciI family protein n=1 Tax=Rhizohabitans arisaemae TaxID=2720610 RepID=UPI0024B282E7|nr:YciI family protein [Rhizohabitans arisaemae]
MLYTLLLIGDEEQWAKADEAERQEMYARHEAFGKLLEERGAERGGGELAHSSSATTVRKVGDDFVITDGPFAETSEQLGGFYIVEARDLDEAIEFAKAVPGDVEIRPLVDPSAQ